MRVLYIATAFIRHEGDVITPWLTETIRLLKKRGVDIEVLVSSYQGQADHTVYGIKVRRFRYFPARLERLTHEETVPDRLKKGMGYRLLVLPYILGGIIRAVRLCRTQRYDLVHVHWPFPHAIIGYFGKMAAKCPMVSTFHGVELRWVKTKMRFLIPFLRWAIRKSGGVTANSTITKKHILSIEARDVDIIPFGAGLKTARPTPIPPHNLVLFVGRLVERKGVGYLIESIRILTQRMNVKLVVVGEGPERQNLESQVRESRLQDRVAFAGRVGEKELDLYYRSCSAFVLPAVVDSKGDTEGLGVVLIEALSYGRPVIASNVGGIIDVVEDGRTGLLVPEKDPEALALALEKVLSDRRFAEQLVRNGLYHVQKNFAWSPIIDALLSLYSSLVPVLSGTTIVAG